MRIFLLLILFCGISSQGMLKIKNPLKSLKRNKHKLTSLDVAIININDSVEPQDKIIFGSVNSKKIEKAVESYCIPKPNNWAFITCALNALVPSTEELSANEKLDTKDKKNIYINDDVKKIILSLYCKLEYDAYNANFIGIIQNNKYSSDSIPYCSYNMRNNIWCKYESYNDKDTDFRTKESGCELLITCFNAKTIKLMRKNHLFSKKIKMQLKDAKKNPDVSHLFVIDKHLQNYILNPYPKTIEDIKPLLSNLIDMQNLTTQMLNETFGPLL